MAENMDDGRALLESLRAAVRGGTAPPPRVRRALAGTGDAMLVRRAGKILAGLRTADGGLRPASIAVLATCTVGPLADILRATLVGAGVLPAIELAGYRTFDLTLAGAAFGGGTNPAAVELGNNTGPTHRKNPDGVDLGNTSPAHHTNPDAVELGDDTGPADGKKPDGVELGDNTGPADGNGTDLVACLLDESYFLPPEWSPAAGPTDAGAFAEHLRRRLADLSGLLAAGLRRTTATVVMHTVPLPAEVLDSHLSVRARAAVARAWHELNAGLLGLAAEHRQVVVVDLVTELAAGPFPARDRRLHRFADLPYTDGALLTLARLVSRVAQAMAGLSRKVLALDLDNTLWGGVLGEVGGHGVQLGGLYPGNCYRQLQRAVRRLGEQGVVLVLASKNDAELVTATLTEHPEALLRPDAFAVTAVNWSPKAENLRQAAEGLGLAPQSFVFMDDSAFERGHVGAELPEVALVAADGDPANLEHELLRAGWFDVMELTDTDRRRPALYRSRALRGDFASGFGSSRDYLLALDIEVLAEPVTAYTVARVAQLAARTNQFNLTGIRFDEASTAAMSTDPDHLVASFAVSDRFGDEGIVGAAWVRRDGGVWQVRNAVLSCRVLGRGVELAMAGWLAARAAADGAVTLQGRYVPSARNAVAADFWARAGFAATAQDGVFVLDLTGTPYRAPEWIRLRERSAAPHGV